MIFLDSETPPPPPPPVFNIRTPKIRQTVGMLLRPLELIANNNHSRLLK